MREKQGWEFQFLNRLWEPYEWTDTVLEENPEFQGLLKEEAPFPDISTEIPGVPLAEEEDNMQVVKPKLAFEMLEAAELKNAGINSGDWLQAARAKADAANAGVWLRPFPKMGHN